MVWSLEVSYTLIHYLRIASLTYTWQDSVVTGVLSAKSSQNHVYGMLICTNEKPGN